MVITLRIILIIGAITITELGGYYQARSCAQLHSIYGDQSATLAAYADCAPYFSGQDVNKWVAVEGNFHGDAAGSAVALGANFGSALWLAFAIHAIGVEIYVRRFLLLKCLLHPWTKLLAKVPILS